MAKNYMSENDYKNADYTMERTRLIKHRISPRTNLRIKTVQILLRTVAKMLPMQIRTAVSAGYRC